MQHPPTGILQAKSNFREDHAWTKISCAEVRRFPLVHKSVSKNTWSGCLTRGINEDNKKREWNPTRGMRAAEFPVQLNIIIQGTTIRRVQQGSDAHFQSPLIGEQVKSFLQRWRELPLSGPVGIFLSCDPGSADPLHLRLFLFQAILCQNGYFLISASLLLISENVCLLASGFLKSLRVLYLQKSACFSPRAFCWMPICQQFITTGLAFSPPWLWLSVSPWISLSETSGLPPKKNPQER